MQHDKMLRRHQLRCNNVGGCRLTGYSKRTPAGVHKRVSRQDDLIDYYPLSV
jgi:hypothetical protein